MKKKFKKLIKKIVKGAILGAVVSLTANLITYHAPGYMNILIASLLAIFIYLILHIEAFE